MHQLPDKNEILLESGTNELEIVEFCVDDGITAKYFGVNVAKVREIIRRPLLRSVVHAPDSIAGMMTLRSNVIPVIDLAVILGQHQEKEADKIVVLEFNRVVVGVLVNSVSRIYRLSWGQIESPPAISSGSYITGVVKMDDRIILILDFEGIIATLYGTGVIETPALVSLDEGGRLPGIGKKILVADDSTFIRNQICASLKNAGYTVIETINGEEAWKVINGALTTGSFDIDAIISDVEMPIMDGLHLVKLIREKPLLVNLPVFVFSSLASEENIKKWENLAINKVLTKPDLPLLVTILGTCLAECAGNTDTP